MDSFTFIAELVKAVAWPGTAIVLALLLRRPILNLLEGIKLTKLKRGDWEAEFAATTQELRREMPAASKALWGESNELVAELEPMMRSSPTEAVLAAWNRVESTVHQLGDQHGVRPAGFMPTLNELVQKQVIPEATKDSLLGLRQLRQLAVHGPKGELSEARAHEFLVMADAIHSILRSQTKPR